jgi:hypothetical protein
MRTLGARTALCAAIAMAVAGGGFLSLAAAEPETPTPAQPKELKLEIHYVTHEPCLNTIAYPTCHTWSADGKWLFIESTRPRPDGIIGHKNERQLLKVNIETGETVHLATLEVEDTKQYGEGQVGASSQYHTDYAPEANVLLYYDMTGHNMYLMDVATGRSNRILHEPEGTIGDPPSITPDGKRVVYYVLFRALPNRFLGGVISVIFALDVDPATLQPTGEPKVITAWPSRLDPAVAHRGPNGVIVNHSQVNPKDHDHYCYAHEFGGARTDGSLLLTRCWENRHGIDRPLDIPTDLQGQTHEVIGPLGTSLYFVENWHVSAVDFATYQKRRICEDSPLRPSHITVSPDEKWIAADKWGGDEPAEDGLLHSGIILIETATGDTQLICEFLRGASHPRHPHPSFSPDGTRIAFVVSDGPETSQVAWVDVGGIVSGEK